MPSSKPQVVHSLWRRPPTPLRPTKMEVSLLRIANNRPSVSRDALAFAHTPRREPDERQGRRNTKDDKAPQRDVLPCAPFRRERDSEVTPEIATRPCSSFQKQSSIRNVCVFFLVIHPRNAVRGGVATSANSEVGVRPVESDNAPRCWVR